MNKQITNLIVTVTGLVALSLCGWYWHKSHPDQPSNKNDTTAIAPTPRNPDVPEEAMEAYDKAKGAVYERDYGKAAEFFQKAVEIKSDFTEAWYNLGAAQSYLAIGAMKFQDEKGAVQHFRDGVESKKKARDLMKEGKWFIYNEEQQNQTRADVEETLKDADEVLADEPSLIEALKLWAHQK